MVNKNDVPGQNKVTNERNRGKWKKDMDFLWNLYHYMN